MVSSSTITKSKNMKKVGQYTLDDIFIKEYNSIKQASEDTLIGLNSISRCCIKERKTGGGYIWKFIQ